MKAAAKKPDLAAHILGCNGCILSACKKHCVAIMA